MGQTLLNCFEFYMYQRILPPFHAIYGSSHSGHGGGVARLTMTGRMCVICPVSSNTMTEVDMVCVTPPAMAAAPTTAYPPGLINLPLMPDEKV